jgi:hypothetical protein
MTMDPRWIVWSLATLPGFRDHGDGTWSITPERAQRDRERGRPRLSPPDFASRLRSWRLDARGRRRPA